MKFETKTYSLPAYWGSYLINGDASGMGDGEQRQCDGFSNGLGYGWQCVDVSEESDFRHSNDAGTLAGDCADYTFIREKSPRKGTLERYAFDLLEYERSGLDVIAYELTHDGCGWSVNTPFKIASNASLPEVLEAIRGRFEAFRANYASRATVKGLADISDVDGVWELESNGLPFLRIEVVG